MSKNDLTPEQIDDLKDLYVERMVDNMSTKDLVNYVTDDMNEYVKSISDQQFIDEAYSYWDDYFDEIISNIEKLANLKDKGIISEYEYKKKKKDLLKKI